MADDEVRRFGLLKERLHSERHPHWSLAVQWRPGRWDPMSNAPSEGYPILHVRGRTADGRIVEPMHRACGDGDGLMPPFNGWFVPSGASGIFGTADYRHNGFYEVRPVEWQPLTASPEEERHG